MCGDSDNLVAVFSAKFSQMKDFGEVAFIVCYFFFFSFCEYLTFFFSVFVK